MMNLLGVEQTSRNRKREHEMIHLELRLQILRETSETLDRLQRVGRANGEAFYTISSIVEVDKATARREPRKHWFIVTYSGFAAPTPVWWRLFGEKSVAPMSFWMRDDGEIVCNVRSADLKLRSRTTRANLELLDEYGLRLILGALRSA